MPTPKKGIKYHVSNELERGQRNKEENDPMSPTFIPLTERSETGRARWWAQRGKAQRNKQTMAELD